MFVMFFVIMTSAPQLLNSVIEEKMSRISEVLLGSVTPFELMMGKLLGNAGIAMLLAALYVGGGYRRRGVLRLCRRRVSPGLIAALARLPAPGDPALRLALHGRGLGLQRAEGCPVADDAGDAAVDAADRSSGRRCSRTRRARCRSGMSLFPPASPFLMLMRLAMRPAPPAWQVGLSVVLTTLTALVCVWAAGKIFRTGLLMQGKAPSFAELARWVMAK